MAAAQLEQADRALDEHKARARQAMERVKEKREEMEEMHEEIWRRRWSRVVSSRGGLPSGH